MKKITGFLTLAFAIVALNPPHGPRTRPTRYVGVKHDPGVKGDTPAKDTSSVWKRVGGIQWAFVHGGTFRLGSNDGRRNEKPVHRVTLGSFYMSATEVTFAQYDIFCDSTEREKPSDAGWGRGKRPVIDISWYDAMAYCYWLSSRTGDSVCLPTESEYEYAARGGMKSEGYEYSGSNDIGKVAWYINNSGIRTQDVGTKEPNELGLYDMSGNVWEWCADWYHPNYDGTPSDRSAWGRTGSGDSLRVVRGGSWYDFARDCRVSIRDGIKPADWSYVLGFRIVRPLR